MRFVFAPPRTVRPPAPIVREFTPDPSMTTASVLLARNVRDLMEKSCPSVVLIKPDGVTGEAKKTSSPLPGTASGSLLTFNCVDQLLPANPVLVFQLRPLS